MKFNRTLVMCLTIALCACMVMGGTLAYLTDTDSDVNVMTLGSVEIEQIEQEWNAAKTELKDFTQNKPLMPYVGNMGWENTEADDGAYRRFTMNNVVDKYVSVKNTGKSPAYVRTLIALEMGDYAYEDFTLVGISNNSIAGSQFPGLDWRWTDDFVITLDGHNYNVMVAVHDQPLAPDSTTIPSLLQLYLSKEADNEDVEKLDGNKNGTYDVLVLSQAVQTAGFSDPVVALNEAFGPATKDNAAVVAGWFEGMDKTVPDTNTQPITLEPGKTQRLTGAQPSLAIAGSGTLILDGVTIESESGNGITIAENANVTLTVSGSTTVKGAEKASGIKVENGAKLTLNGSGSLNAIGNAGNADNEMVDNYPACHGIGGAGDIVITGLSSLTAKGYGEGGFGIGGGKNVTITDTNIKTVKGGQPVSAFDYIADQYGKSQLEGGAAIGSGVNGAVITLDNVVVEEAIGGSKAAAIGARYWTGVTVDIKNSTIKKAVGGGTSAGIGGARVSSNAANSTKNEDIFIKIHNSTVNAAGGTYGAGIGSGYNTYCTAATKCDIQITGASDITATGGAYAAGIGTGYHNGLLSGKIEAGVKVNATAGTPDFYKADYTTAQPIGFGVIDPAREADKANNKSTFDNQGTIITVPDDPTPNP